MSNSTVEITMQEGAADAYVSRPDDGAHRGVLFLMDAYGLRATIGEMVERIAAEGFIVLAPNVFYRGGRSPIVPPDDIGDANRGSTLWDTIRPLMAQLTPDVIASDGSVYLDYLAGLGATGPVAITGYCMGGRLGWGIAAAHADRVAALAAFHTGGLVSDADDSPHLRARDVQAELYFGFADEDANMTPEQIATLEQALDEAGARYRSEVYAGARHGYTMADLPVFDENARERHFRELRTLLERSLG
jgi:carboxymethylenebutenolidase